MRSDRFDHGSHWDPPGGHPPQVRSRPQPYIHFSRWLDGQLEKLVAEWAHTAVPNLRRAKCRFGKPKPK